MTQLAPNSTNWHTVSTNLISAFPENLATEAALAASNIHMVPKGSKVTAQEIRLALHRPSGAIVACDFRVENIESGTPNPGLIILTYDDILNVDHHANLPPFRDKISSTNLAIEYVKRHGPVNRDIPICINHCDCDSVLSALIMRGLLPPDERLGAAAIAADHTGAANDIADLLQALKIKTDFAYSARNLSYLLKGSPLEESAKQLYERRLADRDSAQDIPVSKATNLCVLIDTGERRIDGELLVGIHANKVAIVSHHKRKGNGRTEVRVRLGQSAPQGLNLRDLALEQVDVLFGGRWNAMSNERGPIENPKDGGTTADIVQLFDAINQRIEDALAA